MQINGEIPKWTSGAFRELLQVTDQSLPERQMLKVMLKDGLEVREM